MKNGQQKIYVTTPQGTLPLEEYGSFIPQFKKPQYNVAKFLDFDVEKGTGDMILSVEDLLERSKGKTLTETCRNAKSFADTKQGRNESLPSLDDINAHVTDGWVRMVGGRRTHEKVMELHRQELKRLSDHELTVYINLIRHRKDGIYGTMKTPSQAEYDKYMSALEERSRRADQRA